MLPVRELSPGRLGLGLLTLRAGGSEVPHKPGEPWEASQTLQPVLHFQVHSPQREDRPMYFQLPLATRSTVAMMGDAW